MRHGADAGAVWFGDCPRDQSMSRYRLFGTLMPTSSRSDGESDSGRESGSSGGSVSRGFSDPDPPDTSRQTGPAPGSGERHDDIRAAKVSIDRTDQGVTMTVTAGKLRLRLYIDAQWADLVQQISAGQGELDGLVPFRMAPFSLEDEEIVSIETIDAHPIPGLSRDDDLHDTSLWDSS